MGDKGLPPLVANTVELVYVIRDDDWLPNFIGRFDFTLACCLHSINIAKLQGRVVVTVVDMASERSCLSRLVRANRLGGFKYFFISPAQLRVYSGSVKFHGSIGNNFAIRRSSSSFCLLQASDCFYTPFQLKNLMRFFESPSANAAFYYMVPRVFLPYGMPVFEYGVELSCEIIDEWPPEQASPVARKHNLGGGFGSIGCSVSLWFELGGLDEHPDFVGSDGDIYSRASIANEVVNLYNYGIRVFKLPRVEAENGLVRSLSKSTSLGFCCPIARHSANPLDWGMSEFIVESCCVEADDDCLWTPDNERYSNSECVLDKQFFYRPLVIRSFPRLRLDWWVNSIVKIQSPSFFVVSVSCLELFNSTLIANGWLNGVICDDSLPERKIYSKAPSEVDEFILSARNLRSRIYRCRSKDLATFFRKSRWAETRLISNPMVWFPDLTLDEISNRLPFQLEDCCLVVARHTEIPPSKQVTRKFINLAIFHNLIDSGPISVWAALSKPDACAILSKESQMTWWTITLSKSIFVVSLKKLAVKFFHIRR
ncbi:hypothetical protein N9W31_00735 [Litoricolaceae bacterium]|nr:hypothetical protein [Litorivicinaceae bacterium]